MVVLEDLIKKEKFQVMGIINYGVGNTITFEKNQIEAILQKKKNQFREIINEDLDGYVFQSLVFEKFGSFSFVNTQINSPNQAVKMVDSTFIMGEKVLVYENGENELALRIEITGISIQQIQNICASDALAEGIAHTEFWQPDALNSADFEEKWWDDFHFWTHYPQLAFANWWKSKFGEDSWNANKWVWVYRFKVAKK